MADNNKFSSGVAWSYLQSWAARGITTISFLVVGWYLGPSEFGVFSVVAAVLLFAEMLCEQTLSQTIVQLKDLDQGKLSNIFVLALSLGLIFASGLGLGASSAAQFFGASELSSLLKVAAICPFLIGLSVIPIGLLRRDLAFKLLAKRTILSSGFSSVLGVFLVVRGFGAWALVAQSICYYAVGLAVLWRNCEWRPSWRINLSAFPEIWRLAGWNAASKFSDFAETRGLELIVGAVGGIQALGIFAFASKLAQTAFQTFAAPVLEVVFAEVARQRSAVNIGTSVRNGQLIVATLPCALLFGLGCVAAPLLAALYGDRWGAAAQPLAILAFAFLARSLIYVLGSALLAIGESRVVLVISATRAGMTIAFCYLALHHGAGATGAAWSYLASALLVAPISSLVLSKKVGVPLKALVAVPIKVCIAAVAGAIVIFFGRYIDNGPLATFAIAVVAGMVFLVTVVFLNAGALVHGLQRSTKSGAIGRLTQTMLRVACAALALREDIRLKWFEITLIASLFLHKRQPHSNQSALVIPADTAELDGSLGDQALLLGFNSLRKIECARIVVAESFTTSAVFASVNFVRAWMGGLAGWRLGKQVAFVDALYIIGADVMDGYYSPTVSRQRLIVASAFAKANVNCGILSFSFNSTPHPAVVDEFRRLPKSVRICLRDAVSLERFERIVGRSAHLVSDLAFLVPPIEVSGVADLVLPWVETQRKIGRRILGVNVNPQVVAHLSSGTESAIADSVAKACETLIQGDTSVVLIPHDFRPGCADLRVMGLVWKRLSATSRSNALLLEEPFSAQEIKSVCKGFDLVFSARMHLAIGALSVGTPVCGMQYQGKFAGLFQHFSMESDMFISPEHALDADSLAAFLSLHLAHCEELKRHVQSHLPSVRELAKLNVASVDT
jgi:colanic acid/amylovoran biosynthesis protein